MKKVLYFDCFSGISGDMTLGALIHLGADVQQLKKELEKLGVSGYNLIAKESLKNGISGVSVDVKIEAEKHHEHRTMKDIWKLLDDSDISDIAKENALAIFHAIGEAEAKVHKMKLSEVHFHELGAVDSIVDVVGTAICLDLLGIDKVYCSVVHDGSGFVECEHGKMPVPVPAVVEMLSGSAIRLVGGETPTELVTPTGMGILKGMNAKSCPMPDMEVKGTGYGFGTRETNGFNALRVVMGYELQPEIKDKNYLSDHVTMMETNLDDESGETLGYVLDNLFDEGALDVYFTPIYMKKKRPATKLSVICKDSDMEKLARMILRDTSSLGIRIYETKRMILPRRLQMVETPYGKAIVKIATAGDVEKISPEYEDCARIAREMDLPITQVYHIVRESYRRMRDGKNEKAKDME